MKKALGVLLIGGMMLFLSACTRAGVKVDFESVNLQNRADSVCKIIVESLKVGDSKAIGDLFSKEAIENASDLNDGISENLELYKDKNFTYECLGNSIKEHYEDSNNECKITGKYLLADQEENQYLLWFTDWYVKDKNPDDVGISLIIITDYTAHERNLKLEEILGYDKLGIYWSDWDK